MIVSNNKGLLLLQLSTWIVKGMIKNMEKKVEVSILCQIYGKLLTEKQYEFIVDYYNNDLSLSEIAENNNITRQAVRDVIKKGENKLFEFEEKLLIMKKMRIW